MVLENNMFELIKKRLNNSIIILIEKIQMILDIYNSLWHFLTNSHSLYLQKQ